MRKTFLGCKICKRLWENLHLKKAEKEFTIAKFSKVRALRKGRSGAYNLTSRGSSLQANSWKMAALFLITTSRKSLACTWSSIWGVVCRSSWRPWPARPSPWRWSPVTPSRMWRPRSRIRKASPLTSRGLSLQANSWKMAALFLITTSRKSQHCTWSSVWGVAVNYSVLHS